MVIFAKNLSQVYPWLFLIVGHVPFMGGNVSQEACKCTPRADLSMQDTFLISISIVSLEDKCNIKTPLKTVPYHLV